MKINSSIEKRLTFTALFVIYPLYLVGACVVSPLYTATASNISYEVLPVILKYLGVFIDIFGIYISLSIAIYGLLKLDIPKTKSVLALILASPLFKNVLKLIVSPIVDGKPTVDIFLMDVYSLGLSSVFEILQLALAIYITYRYAISRYKERVAVIKKAAARLGDSNVPGIEVVPFDSIFNLKNPLQYGAFASSLTVTIVRIIMLIVHDINFGWFFSDINTVLLFVGGYLVEIVIGALGYFCMLYMFLSFASKESDA
jgi:hypothetical protein